MTLVQALAVAGGLAPDADWRNVEVIASDPVGGTYLVRVDLEREIQSGRGGPEIRPGDSIRVPVRDPNLAQVALGALRGTLEASRDVLNLLLVRDVLTNDNNN
jgi:protein involved in polysaccharide export with SLBB domain